MDTLQIALPRASVELVIDWHSCWAAKGRMPCCDASARDPTSVCVLPEPACTAVRGFACLCLPLLQSTDKLL